MNSTATTFPPLALIVALSILLVGCDNTIEPFDQATGLYSVYGVLTLDDEPDLIRVRDLNQPHIDRPDQPLDATVTLQNMTAGTAEVLRDSMIAFDGHYTHNFWTDTPVEPNTTYRLTVERSDGATASATATTPPLAEVAAHPAADADCLMRITVVFHDVPSPRLLEAEVGYMYRGNFFWSNASVARSSENSAALQFVPETLLSEIIESQDDPATDGLYETRCGVLDEEYIHVRYTHFGPEWLDVNLPINPLESWDVEGGLGFFGALRSDDFSIPIDTSAVSLLP